MGKQMLIPLSFKKNEEWLYDEICKHSGKCAWVKDIVAEYIRNQNSANNTQATVQEDNNINFQGFLNFK
jgi:hypothetical protein